MSGRPPADPHTHAPGGWQLLEYGIRHPNPRSCRVGGGGGLTPWVWVPRPEVKRPRDRLCSYIESNGCSIQSPNLDPVLEIECISKLVIIVSDCIPGFRSVCPMCIPTFKCVYHMCIPTFSSFIVLCAQVPSPSFPCGSSPDTMKQLSLKPHLTAPSARDDDPSSSSGSPAPFFMVCMYHMCIPGF